MDTPEAPAGQGPAEPAPDAERPVVVGYAADWPGRASSLIATYSEVKDPVVDLVITVAGTWAADTGWQP